MQTAAAPSVPPVLCRDCAHHRRFLFGLNGELDKCRGEPKKVSFIHGGEVNPGDHTFASLNRQYGHLCGPDARWFKPSRSLRIATFVVRAFSGRGAA